jgi:hypothetical protein
MVKNLVMGLSLMLAACTPAASLGPADTPTAWPGKTETYVFLLTDLASYGGRTPSPPATAAPTVLPTVDAVVGIVAAASDTPQPTEPATETSVPAIANTEPAPVPVELLLFTTPISAGKDAWFGIKTLRGARCFLAYTTPSGTDSTAAGLGAQTADTDGRCRWTWNISASTNAGTGHLLLTVNGQTFPYDIVIE